MVFKLVACIEITFWKRSSKGQDEYIKKILWILEKEGNNMDKIINDVLGSVFGFTKKIGRQITLPITLPKAKNGVRKLNLPTTRF